MLSSTSLLHGNCVFNRNNTVATQQGMKTYWLCKSYRICMCRARCITHQGRVISATGVHNHTPHMRGNNATQFSGGTSNVVSGTTAISSLPAVAETSNIINSGSGSGSLSAPPITQQHNTSGLLTQGVSVGNLRLPTGSNIFQQPAQPPPITTLATTHQHLQHHLPNLLIQQHHDLITRNIDKAKYLIEEGGDWDRRNRLKVYQGVYSVAVRDFKAAATFFLDTVSTFTSYELMDYPTFVRYTVYVAMIALPRNELRDKVIKGAEIQEVLHSLPDVKNYLFSLYNCQYAEFFRNLSQVETILYNDYLANPHYRFYVREMRILAYTQLLDSYRSLTLQYMAEAFGVDVEYIDQELSRFIAAGRLHAKVDRVGGIVETNRPDNKNWQYQSTIKQGDLLLNRIQKLSRVINI